MMRFYDFLAFDKVYFKNNSPINSEDHSFYKHIKRLADRSLSDSKLSRSARILKSDKGLLLVFQLVHNSLISSTLLGIIYDAHSNNNHAV